VWPIRDRTVRQTDVVELVGLLRQQEARENFEAGRLVDFRLELEQRLDLVLAEPDSLEAARAERQRQGLQPVDEHHSRHVTVAYTSRQRRPKYSGSQYIIRSVPKGPSLPPALKGHFSADCLSANIWKIFSVFSSFSLCCFVLVCH